MGRSSYQKSFNEGAFLVLLKRIEKLAKEKRYLEAFFIEVATIEVVLRGLIRCLCVLRQIDKQIAIRYWDDSRTRFTLLVDYYECLGGSQAFANDMREYYDQRNKIIHQMVSVQDEDELLQNTERAYNCGHKIYGNLFNERIGLKVVMKK